MHAANSPGAAIDQINRAWLHGRAADLEPLLHPQIVMVLPGFSGRSQGREAFLAGFEDFCQGAKIEQFRELDRQVEEIGSTAVVTFRYEMTYSRDRRYRCTGRDIWVLAADAGVWLAVWRTMLELEENPAG